MTHRTKSLTKPKPRSSDTAARWAADLFCLWRFCEKHSCRRSRACKGLHLRACFRALPLVPPEALLFLKRFEEGQNDWLSFDEMMARSEEEWAAVEDWQARVIASLPESDWPADASG